GRIGVRHLGPSELQTELLRLLRRLVVEVPANLEVIRDEADGADENVAGPLRVQLLEVVEDVRAEPRLPGRRFALERERPTIEAGPLGDELRRLQQLLLVDRCGARR